MNPARERLCNSCQMKIEEPDATARTKRDWRPLAFVLGFAVTVLGAAIGVQWLHWLDFRTVEAPAFLGSIVCPLVGVLYAAIEVSRPRHRVLAILAGILWPLMFIATLWTALIYDKVPWKWNTDA